MAWGKSLHLSESPFPAGLLWEFNEIMHVKIFSELETTFHVQGRVILLRVCACGLCMSVQMWSERRLNQRVLLHRISKQARQTSDTFARSQHWVLCSSARWCERVCMPLWVRM